MMIMMMMTMINGSIASLSTLFPGPPLSSEAGPWNQVASFYIILDVYLRLAQPQVHCISEVRLTDPFPKVPDTEFQHGFGDPKDVGKGSVTRNSGNTFGTTASSPYTLQAAIQQKSPDRALFLYIFIHEIRSSGVRASITIVHI